MSNSLMLVKKDTVDVVAERVRIFQEKGELHFPSNYSPENAMKSAWLTLQETENKDHKKALDVCTKDSIANALLNMVVQGLNPAKKQCYFIPYGNQLTLQRSYFGTMHVAKSIRPDIEEINADVVYQGDEFEYEKIRGRNVITKHKQKLENVDKTKIIAAYCSVYYEGGKEETTIMNIEDIKQAWKQSKMNPITEKGAISASSVHGKFTAEMCKRTVTNKACKVIINSSNDSNLLMKAYRNTDDSIVEAEAEAEIAEHANKTIIDVETGEITDAGEPSQEASQVFEDIATDDLP